MFPRLPANAGYQASHLAPVLLGVANILLEGIARCDVANPDLRLNDAMWKVLKMRLWVLAHLLSYYFPNVGDFLDASERRQFVLFLEAKTAKQPLNIRNHIETERDWDDTLRHCWENAREQGLKGVLLAPHHASLFSNVLDRGHSIQKPGEDQGASIRVGPSYIDRLQACLAQVMSTNGASIATSQPRHSSQSTPVHAIPLGMPGTEGFGTETYFAPFRAYNTVSPMLGPMPPNTPAFMLPAGANQGQPAPPPPIFGGISRKRRSLACA